MARIRTLKPEFWTDEKLALLSPLTRLVFLGLLSQADDSGRLVDNVKLLDGMLFPSTDDSCRAALSELSTTGRIIRYQSESGQALIQVAGWDKHQKVKNPSRYTLPAPPTPKAVDSTPKTVETPPYDPLSPIPDPLPPTPPQEGRAATAGLTAEMVGDLEDWAERELPDAAARKGFLATGKQFALGEDRTAWEDGRGDPAPWEDRPRLMRLALARLESGESNKLRGALRWVVPQQFDPDRQRTAIVGEAQNGASPGFTTTPEPDVLAKLKAEHPQEYAEALSELEHEVWWADEPKVHRAEAIRQAVKGKTDPSYRPPIRAVP